MIWERLKYLRPASRRREEADMREELEALAAIAGRRELGNLTIAMENARETWGWVWLESVAADIRYAFRGLRAQPGFFTLAVFSLALAIGANSAIFSFADALLLRPLPVADPAAMFDVTNTTPDNPFEGMSFPDYHDVREQSRSFTGLIAYRLTPVAAATHAAATAQIRLAMLVSDNFFSSTRVVPTVGRAFLPDEANPPGQARAVISEQMWREQYARDPSAIGSSLRINGIAFTIVGVMPESFTGLDRFARPTVFFPLAVWQRLDAMPKDPLQDRGIRGLVVKGRLKAGATRESAQAELAIIGSALERADPKINHNRRLAVRTEFQRRVEQTPQLVALVRMLMGLVGLILLIACSNVANLLLARARARSREVAIRLSIGAGRIRLIRQFLTESLVIALAGGAAGLFVAYAGIRLLQNLSVPSEPPSVLGVELDLRVVEFSALAALVSCVLFGLAPAWQTVRMDYLSALKRGGHGISGQPRTWARHVLVACQISLATVVLIAAGMFLGGFKKMLVTRPDFRTDHIISMDTAPAMLHYSPAQTKWFYRSLVDRLRELTGAKSVAMTESIPLSTSQSTVAVVPEDYQFPKGREKAVVFGSAVDASYFSVMNVEIKRGRAFTDDDRAGSKRVTIVNEQFAKTYWPDRDPVGKRIRLDAPDGPEAEVVGVAKTGRYLLINEAPAPYVYLPYAQNPRARMTMVVQSNGAPAALAAPLREAVRSIDADVPVFNLRPVTTLYESRATGTWRQLFQMVGTMALIGLILAMTGLYGLIAYTVSRQVKEIGIRVAVGANPRDVLWLVQRRGLILGGVGIAIGGLVTVTITPLLAAGFPGLEGSASMAYLTVPLLLLAVSAAASYVPARRAAGVDPLRVLRSD